MIPEIRRMGYRGWEGTYRPETGLFPFRARRSGEGVVLEGESLRYTAIALIGLAGEDPAGARSALSGSDVKEACSRLVERGRRTGSPGDAALVLWACCAAGIPACDGVRERLAELLPGTGTHPTVEVAWALAALCNDPEPASAGLRDRLAKRLLGSFDARSGMFPHRIEGSRAASWPHVSCFADMVYPVHALSLHHRMTGDRESLSSAERAAARICGEQGPAGQWWWHYDRRTGAVVERYPVYAVHQDSMAPMALFALREAGGTDYGENVRRGLAWLGGSPELDEGSLIDRHAGFVWRKVARREPAKLSRYAQALASRIHPSLRIPGIDRVFPPVSVDYEDRPYHFGWLLYAFPGARPERSGNGGKP